MCEESGSAIPSSPLLLSAHREQQSDKESLHFLTKRVTTHSKQKVSARQETGAGVWNQGLTKTKTKCFKKNRNTEPEGKHNMGPNQLIAALILSIVIWFLLISYCLAVFSTTWPDKERRMKSLKVISCQYCKYLSMNLVGPYL